MSSSTEEVGTGTNLFTAGTITGTARWFNDTSDVLSIDDDDLEETIAFVNKGGMTFLSPILPDLKAIVCTAGSRESHLAILSPRVRRAVRARGEADRHRRRRRRRSCSTSSDAETARIAVTAGAVTA